MRGRLVVAAAVAGVVITAVAIAWIQAVPHISGDDAVTAAEGALEDAGLEAVVEPNPTRSTYVSESRDPVEVWTVHATVRSEPIELQLALAGADAIFIDDRTPDRSAFVLSDLEYEAVADSVSDPAEARAFRRNIALTIGAVLLVALAVAHAAVAARTKETPG